MNHSRRCSILFGILFALMFLPSGDAHAQTPTLSIIQPNQARPGDEIRLAGSNFTLPSSIEIRDQYGNFVTWNHTLLGNSESEIIFRLGSNIPEGTYRVTVVTSACKGGCDSNPLNLYISDDVKTPQISSVSPTKVAQNGILTIYGSNLEDDPTVTIKGRDTGYLKVYEPRTISSNKLTVQLEDVPPGEEYTARVDTSQCKGGCTSNGEGFNVIADNASEAKPVIESIQSKASDINEVFAGETAHVHGTGLRGPLKFQIGTSSFAPIYVSGYGTSDTFATFVPKSPNRIEPVSISVRVQNSSGLWSDFHDIELYVNGNNQLTDSTPATSAPTSGSTSLADLLQQIQALQAQLRALQGGSSSSNLPTDTGNAVSACAKIIHDLTYQSRDALTDGDVSALQDFLQVQGHLNSAPTGFFGIMTVQAVKNFQLANGINPTGYVGPLTKAKIASLSCGS